MNDQPVIQLEGVSFSYERTPVLKDVNLAIPERDFVCIIGPNGGGKTTLLKMVAGLLRPDKGSIRVLGKEPDRAHWELGYLPQQTHHDLQFPVTVQDVVLMGRLARHRAISFYNKKDREIARRVLDEVGMLDCRLRPFSDLSGGQRQRVLIARALACEPRILLLDEPSAGLDPAVQENLYALLRKLNERLTVIIVSHDVGFVSLYFRTVVCVHQTVHKHPSSELTGERLANMYGREVRLLHTHGGEGKSE